MDEIDREDAVGLRGEELLPGRACAAGRGVDPRSMQDLPHRGSCDPVAELDEFALHAPVPPRRIVRRDADDKLPDGGCHGRSSGTPPACVIPFAATSRRCQASSVAGGHREYLGPPLPGDQLGQRRERQPVARLVADPADLAAQYRVLVSEYQEFGILGCPTPGEHHQAAEQAARDQVDDREDHSAMIPTRRAAPGQIQ